MDSFKGRSFHTYHWPHEPVEHGRQAGRRDRHRRHRRPGDRRDRRQGGRAHRVPAPAELVRAAATTGRSPTRRWPTSRRATTRSSPPAPARRAASCTSPTAAASSRCRARSGWRCGRSSTTSRASASGSANFREIFTDEEANAEFSEFIADRIRRRVKDPVVAEKLIPQRPRLRRAAGADGDALLRGLQPRPTCTWSTSARRRSSASPKRDCAPASATTTSTSSCTPPASTPSPAPSTSIDIQRRRRREAARQVARRPHLDLPRHAWSTASPTC